MTIAEQGVERLSAPSSLLNKVDIRTEREGGLVEAMVPVELVDQTEVPVDEGHVQELVESMLNEERKGTMNGQLTPVLLAQVIGKEKLSIIDGFHRSAATERRGSPTIYGTIMPPMTEDEISDLRILTATSHKKVSFARMNEWVSESWSKTPWADRVTSAQAFNLASNKAMNGRYMGVTPEEVEAIRAWAIDKCTRWGTVPTTIRSVMTTAQIADPELMSKAQTRSSGHELRTITPLHLTAIANGFPYRHAEQNLVADMAVAMNLTVSDTKSVVNMLKDIEDVEAIRSTIEITDWSVLVGRKTPGRKRKTEKTTTSMEGLVVEAPFSSHSLGRKFLIAQLNIGRLTLNNVVLRGDFAASPLHDPHVPVFSLIINKENDVRNALESTSGQDQSDAIADRLEVIAPKLKTIFMAKGLDEQASEHAIRSIGQRLSRDIEEGALQFARIDKESIIDGLIRATIPSEITAAKASREIAPVDQKDTRLINFNAALKLAPEIQDNALTTLALVGLMGANVHTVAQTLGTDKLIAGQLVETVAGRLVSSERSMTSN